MHTPQWMTDGFQSQRHIYELLGADICIVGQTVLDDSIYKLSNVIWTCQIICVTCVCDIKTLT